jgi:hypothetical protein
MTDKKTDDHATPAKASRRPNIKYAGRPRWDKGKRKRLDYNAPIEQFSDAGRVVELPSPAAQERNRVFYHPEAALIVRLFPHLYKNVRSK